VARHDHIIFKIGTGKRALELLALQKPQGLKGEGGAYTRKEKGRLEGVALEEKNCLKSVCILSLAGENIYCLTI